MTHFGEHSSPTNGGTSTDTTGSSGTTVGFRYFMGIHMGLARGPIDEIVEIRVGDRTAWSESVTTNSSLPIDAYDLFGGEASEGGVKGTLTFLFGAADQTCPDVLSDLLDGIISSTAAVSAETIAIENQTIEGASGDSYVGIKTDMAGWIYSTHSSGPDVKLGRPWNLNAPLHAIGSAHGAALQPAVVWQIRYHLEATLPAPSTQSDMTFDYFYSMAKDREVRLIAPGTATFLVTIQTSSGVIVDTAAITLHLPA